MDNQYNQSPQDTPEEPQNGSEELRDNLSASHEKPTDGDAYESDTDIIEDTLQRIAAGSLSLSRAPLTVGRLETALLSFFPSEDALEWDCTGLLVGDPDRQVTKVALALDPTVPAIREAAQRGAQVLITHHPAYLDPPDCFHPASSTLLCSGAGVFLAAKHNVALMNFHTTLDVSPRAARVLPGMLGLRWTGAVLEPYPEGSGKGFGQICSVDEGEELTLGHLAARATSVFGRQPRMWGDPHQMLSRVVTCTGSSGGIERLCVGASIDCIVCGEMKYHSALALADAGVALLELGHDVSELPLVAVLAEALLELGMPRSGITVIDQSRNWTYPEAIRV